MKNTMNNKVNIILPITNLNQSEKVYENIIDLIAPFMNSVFSGKVETFLDDLPELLQEECCNRLPREGDLEDVYYSEELEKIVNYDIFCNICEEAIKPIQNSLITGFKASQLQIHLNNGIINNVKKINNHTIILELKPEK